jgi:hypothetical protein
MAWTTPKTWSGSEVLTSSDMNEQVSGNVGYIGSNYPVANNWINFGTNVSQLTQRIESGVTTIPITTGTAGTAVVTFNTAFGSAPRVVMAGHVVTPGQLIYPISEVGTASFKAWILKVTTGTTTFTGTAWWMAIGA